MIVAIGSMFRDSTRYLDRYFDQCRQLAGLLAERGDRLRLLLVEGDSTDGTRDAIAERIGAGILSGVFAEGSGVVERSHGKRSFGSVDDPERWAALAFVCNGVLYQVTDDVDALIYVESDLVWKAETMVRLLDRRGAPILLDGAPFDGVLIDSGHPVDAVAPWCFTAPEGIDGPRGFFYDIWGHVGTDGANFATHPPHHQHAPEFVDSSDAPLVPIQSAGSCVVVGGPVMDRIRSGAARFSEVDCIRGYCRTLGSQLWLDTGAEVRHP